ncbi:hypothetical protein NECAME_11484 [Necator americanus]|uniref:Uncharacterized protein n=1 Tax=Necator americanus TaxID=51031 RepID=W2T562_NECAM|nr:hypothetical protein NECAME_11484 [Necator americanus]ETN76739.1 hypothetical protein NECAME_11484 [Necator americanus]
MKPHNGRNQWQCGRLVGGVKMYVDSEGTDMPSHLEPPEKNDYKQNEEWKGVHGICRDSARSRRII